MIRGSFMPVSVLLISAGIILACAPRAGLAYGSLIISPSSRSYGMGISGVADVSDPSNVYFNPATISYSRGIFLSGLYGKLVPDLANDVYTAILGLAGVTSITVGESTEMGIGCGLRYHRLDYGEWEVTSPANESLGTASSYEYNIAFTLAGAIAINETFSFAAGLSIKPTKLKRAPAESTISGVSGDSDATAMDFGFLMRAAFPVGEGSILTASVGASMLNSGDDFEFESTDVVYQMPSRRRYGAGIRFETPPWEGVGETFGPLLTLAANIDALLHTEEGTEDRSPEWNFGVEAGILRIIYLRAGYWYDDSGNKEDLTLGFGLGRETDSFLFRFDYARVPQGGELAKTNKLGIIAGMKF